MALNRKQRRREKRGGPAPDGAALAPAVAHYRAGRLVEAEAACRRVLAAEPRHPGALHLAGVVAGRAGRHDEAVDLLVAAARADPRNAAAQADLAAMLADAGRRDEAVAAYRRAARIAPDLATILVRLGDLLADMGRADDAVVAYERAAAARPGDATLLSNLGSLLAERGDWDGAERRFRQALDIDPDLAATRTNLGNVLKEQARLDAAIDCYRRALEIDPAQPDAYNGLGAAHLKQGDPAAALAVLEDGLPLQRLPTRTLCYLVVALGALGRHERARRLADFDRHIHATRLPTPPGFADLELFNGALVRVLADHPTLVWEPAGKTTRGGSQTGDLLARPTPAIEAFESALRDAIDGYLAALPADPDHPHFRRIPARYDLKVWSTVLRQDGHQLPHIHASGWLSGVYYAQLPDSAPGGDDHAGWIEFGRPGYDLPATGAQVRAIAPEVGRLLFFPSYFFHRTIPFRGDRPRVSVAFDLAPLAYR